MTGCERNRPKINVYYFHYANPSLNAHLYSEKCLNTAKCKDYSSTRCPTVVVVYRKHGTQSIVY